MQKRFQKFNGRGGNSNNSSKHGIPYVTNYALTGGKVLSPREAELIKSIPYRDRR